MRNTPEKTNDLPYKSFNAYILAGGKSSRMKRDKAFLPIHGKPFIDIIIEELSNIFENIFIVGKKYSHPRIKGSMLDIIKNRGPLGGILTALTHTGSEINFFTGLDYPFINSSIIKILMQIAKDDDFSCSAYVPKLDDGIHPLFAVYNKNILDKVRKCISNGRFSVKCIYESTRTNYINLLIKAHRYSDNLTEEEIKRCFYNLNTLDDYKKLFEIDKIEN